MINTNNYGGVAKGRYPLTTTIPLGVVSRTYDNRFGIVTSTTDVNDLSTSTSYNAFGQKYLQTSATQESTY